MKDRDPKRIIERGITKSKETAKAVDTVAGLAITAGVLVTATGLAMWGSKKDNHHVSNMAELADAMDNGIQEAIANGNDAKAAELRRVQMDVKITGALAEKHRGK